MNLLKRAAHVAALLLVAVFFWPIAVLAQDVVSDPVVITAPTFFRELLTAILPTLGLAITALLTWAANELRKRTGIDIEARHREALQSALVNGILFALQRAGWVAGQPTDPLLSAARGYVEHSVPDALAKFGIDTATSAGRAMLDRLLTPHLPLPAGTVMPNGDKLVGRAP